jgi:curli biogenesis system outer membrane secretion channel CsgG
VIPSFTIAFIRRCCYLAIFAFAFAIIGCRTFSSMRLEPLPPDAIKPVIAVSEFRNESGFSGQWQLGRGIPDLLVAELLKTDHVIVVERQHLGDVVGEISRQGQGLFRKEDSVNKGRLKNARYLVRGVITDFTQTGNDTGWFKTKNLGGGINGSRAVVMVNLTLIDVETGEILTSIPAEGIARAGGKWIDFNYHGVAFGGESFFKTPIGKATQEAISKAAYQIVKSIPYSFWKARIAEVNGQSAIINGGENVGLKQGDTFDAFEPGSMITDPTTGDMIYKTRGKKTGKIVVTQVRETSSDVTIVAGNPKRGDYLEKVENSQAKK